tara:strand:- start:235 stop:471 length:237 start_codon:yes stop_codon:yes gene_type:complete
MCFGRPKPPPLPKPEPVDSAIEQTADKVVVGDKRTSPTKKKSRITPTTGRRRLGTRSLQIPLLTNTQTTTGSLNYPTP